MNIANLKKRTLEGKSELTAANSSSCNNFSWPPFGNENNSPSRLSESPRLDAPETNQKERVDSWGWRRLELMMTRRRKRGAVHIFYLPMIPILRAIRSLITHFCDDWSQQTCLKCFNSDKESGFFALITFLWSTQMLRSSIRSLCFGFFAPNNFVLSIMISF